MNTPALYIISTPIGNLDDMTLRAIDTLRAVDLIAAEDTRHSKKLLQHFGIEKPMTIYEAHSEQRQSDRIVKALRGGQQVGLISDAGTPLISDPGYTVVNDVIEAGFDVIPIPGVSAVIAALAVSGLPTHAFTFAGFLPPKSHARQTVLSHYQSREETIIFYESPHRLLAALNDIAAVIEPERHMVVARELTKLHESIYRGTVKDISDVILADEKAQQGEFVILLSGAPVADKNELTKEDEALLGMLLDELPTNKAASLAAKITGKRRNAFYQHALRTR